MAGSDALLELSHRGDVTIRRRRRHRLRPLWRSNVDFTAGDGAKQLIGRNPNTALCRFEAETHDFRPSAAATNAAAGRPASSVPDPTAHRSSSAQDQRPRVQVLGGGANRRRNRTGRYGDQGRQRLVALKGCSTATPCSRPARPAVSMSAQHPASQDGFARHALGYRRRHHNHSRPADGTASPNAAERALTCSRRRETRHRITVSQASSPQRPYPQTPRRDVYMYQGGQTRTLQSPRQGDGKHHLNGN